MKKGVLQPQLLCHQHIDEFDVTNFYVENGCWEGLYVSGAVFIQDAAFERKRFTFNGEVYHFKQNPSDEMYTSSRNEYSNYISNGEYNAWFQLFYELQEKGEIR